jgi:hypothetical protein
MNEPKKGLLIYKCKRCSRLESVHVDDVDNQFKNEILLDHANNAHECWDGNKGVLELLGAEYEVVNDTK